MAQAFARVINKDHSSSFTNSWSLVILKEVDGELQDDYSQRVELKGKDQSYYFSEGDILNLTQFQDWGWAVGMKEAKATKSRKWN